MAPGESGSGAVGNGPPRDRARRTGGPEPAVEAGGSDPAGPPLVAFTRALAFACEAHANQRRKGAAQEPYVNHLAEVADLVARATGGADLELVIAALLHDTVEDTAVTADELAARFGPRVTAIVVANSDDMSLPKDERRRRRIEAMAHKPADARIVKVADVISNLRATAVSPPAGWGADRRLGYLEGCRQLVDAGRGANAFLEALFDETAAAAERAIREDDLLAADGHARALHELEAGVGQPVFMVHLANTECAALDEAAVDRFVDTIARTFPSAIVERHEAIFEGRRRPILSARIRTDSASAIVALAQRLCLDFDQRFVGIETGGRYVRVYADDTG